MRSNGFRDKAVEVRTKTRWLQFAVDLLPVEILMTLASHTLKELRAALTSTWHEFSAPVDDVPAHACCMIPHTFLIPNLADQGNHSIRCSLGLELHQIHVLHRPRGLEAVESR
ncbi:hypothetical protein MLD38_030872 [Melastoma candidum]|uniref:Uncharacterized protein n=1 Tax=Melastoma candidum TaxID=119954 RepID=A0ACB9MT14_9MYRT|nr:hypothetical protein MLD38_030872 [Melastoma candidum]